MYYCSIWPNNNTHSNSTQQLSDDLFHLNEWCETWKLKLNSRKCAHMRFSLSSKCNKLCDPVVYSVGNSAIVSVNNQKDLGISVTSDLSWSSHYSKICKNAYFSLHLIKRILPVTSSVRLKKQLYITIVRSHFSFCPQLWKPLYAKDFLNLERVQRRATKYLLNDFVSDYKTRLHQLHLLPLSLWLDLQDIMFLIKCLKGQGEDNNFNIFDYIQFSSGHTRSSGVKLMIKYCRTTTYRHFYLNRIVLIYNVIHSIINLSDPIYTIRCKVISFLWSFFDSNFDPSNTCTYHLVCPCNSCHSSGLYV